MSPFITQQTVVTLSCSVRLGNCNGWYGRTTLCDVWAWGGFREGILYHVTSSNGNIFRVTGLLWGNSPVTGEFPAQRPVTRSFDVFFEVAWTNSWANNGYVGDLRRFRAHHDVIVMIVDPPGYNIMLQVPMRQKHIESSYQVTNSDHTVCLR